MGRLYGLVPLEALERVQLLHDSQGRYKELNVGQGFSCPELLKHRNQVVRLLQHTEPSYDSIVRRVDVSLMGLEEFQDWQRVLQVRNQGVPKPCEPICTHDHEKIMNKKHYKAILDELKAQNERRLMTTQERQQRELEELLAETVKNDRSEKRI
uniref:Uncharacterized protein n=1 Tax=Aplanochytrium stocchinoi TaxID=215587 RepID=A0A7S3LSK6_9STRA